MDLITLIGLFAAIAVGLTLIGKFVFSQSNLPINFLRYFVGVWFVFSGVVKAIDPSGTAIKMEEYFEIFEKSVPWLAFLWKFSVEHALSISFFMIILEIYLGFALILGAWKKTTIWLLILLILFFTFLTGYSAKTGKVTDCGCFGDFLKLAPIQSFYKDVFLSVLILIILFGQKNIKELFGKLLGKIVLMSFTLASIVFAYRNIYWEPIVDFRPYQIGTSIPEGLKLPPNAKPYKYENVYTYKNKKTGVLKTFPPNQFPDAADYDNWEYVDRKDIMIQKGDDPKLKDFGIKDADGADVSNDFFTEEEYIFFIIIPELKKVNVDGYKKMIKVVDAAADDGRLVFILTGSLLDDMQAFADKYKQEYEYGIFNTDATPLKTILRSNPGLLILKKGSIVGKYHYNELSTYADLKKSVIK